MELPSTLWFYWDQGLDKAPRIVKAALESWRHHNPDWQIRFLDAESVEVRQAARWWKDKKMGIASRSDLLRLSLLSAHGGVWVDATTLCLRPLNQWLPDVFDRRFGFYGFDNRPIATWFLASAREGPVLTEWLRRAQNFWEGRKPGKYNYFWAKAQFRQMLKDDPQLAKIDLGDARIGKGVCRGPHAFCDWKNVNMQPLNPSLLQRLVTESPPLLKMTHKRRIRSGSQIDFLVRCFEPMAAQSGCKGACRCVSVLPRNSC